MMERISADDTKADFRCGVHALDDYFRRHALENDRMGVNRCFVLKPGENNLPNVVGFYTLSMNAVEAADATPHLKGRFPRYPLPVALIGRLAVDQRARGRGFGDQLLVDALRRALRVGEDVGCVGVIVDAKDDAATRFYARHGFMVTQANRMFLSCQRVREAMLIATESTSTLDAK